MIGIGKERKFSGVPKMPWMKNFSKGLFAPLNLKAYGEYVGSELIFKTYSLS